MVAVVTPGGAGAAGSTCALSLWSARGRRCGARAGVGGTGKSAQPGEERMAAPQSRSGDSSIFFKASCRYSSMRTAPRILLNWLPREGSGKGSMMEAPILREGCPPRKGQELWPSMTSQTVYPLGLPVSSGPVLPSVPLPVPKESSGP